VIDENGQDFWKSEIPALCPFWKQWKKTLFPDIMKVTAQPDKKQD